MDDWLRHRAEEAQRQRATVRRGMVLSPCIYFGARRCTTSDVVSVVTTTRPIGMGTLQEVGVATSLGQTLPAPSNGDPRLESLNETTTSSKSSTKITAPLKVSLYTSPLERPSVLSVEERAKKNAALWAESEAFMEKLASRRLARERAEVAAATDIQRTFRGHMLRVKFVDLHRQMQTRNRMRKVMRRNLRMTGWCLRDVDFWLQRKVERDHAASTLQRAWRCKLALRAAGVMRLRLAAEVRSWAVLLVQNMVRRRMACNSVAIRWAAERRAHCAVAARLVQSGFRQHAGKKRVRRRRYALHCLAATLISRCWRRHAARRAVATVRSRRVAEQSHRGAVAIQTFFRMKLMQNFVRRARREEHDDLCAAAALWMQRIVRGWLGRRAVRLTRNNKFRRQKERSATLIQQAIRGFVSRVVIGRKLVIARTDIFFQAKIGDIDKVTDLFSGLGTDQQHSNTDVDIDGNTILQIAAQYGRIGIVRKCFVWGFNPNHVNLDGDTALKIAICSGRANVCEYLLAKPQVEEWRGIKIDTRDGTQVSARTLLHDAAQQGLFETCLGLFRRKVDAHVVDPVNFRTPLIEATAGGHTQVVETLLPHADVSKNIGHQDERGDTALHHAARGGHDELVRKLLAADAAEGGGSCTVANDKGDLPFRVAVDTGKMTTAMLLKARHFDPEKMMKGYEQSDGRAAQRAIVAGDFAALQAFLDLGVPVNFVDEDGGANAVDIDGNSLAMLAALSLNFAGLKELVERKASLAARNRDGETALHLACRTEGDVREVTAYIAALMRDLPQDEAIKVIEARDPAGRQVLHTAALAGLANVVKALITASIGIIERNQGTPKFTKSKAGSLSAGVGVAESAEATAATQAINTQDGAGMAPLHYAVQGKTGENVTSTLLDMGADVNQTDNMGRTPLHHAAQNSFGESGQGGCACARRLLSVDASAFVLDNNGDSPLHVAARSGLMETLFALLEAMGDHSGVDYPSGKGQTIGFAAVEAEKGGLECLELIMNYGANLTHRDHSGSTMLRHAIEHHRNDCVNLLLQRAPELLGEVYGSGSTVGGGESRSAEDEEELRKQIQRQRAGKRQHTVLHSKVEMAVNSALGDTPIHVAARANNLEAMEMLIAAGNAQGDLTLVERRNGLGATPLYHAASGCCEEVLQALLDLGAEVDIPTPDGGNLLHCVSAGNDVRKGVAIVRQLVGMGLDVNARDSQFRTPLHVACMQGPKHESEPLILALLSCGSFLNNHGLDHVHHMSPLHYAASTCSFNAAETLLMMGFDPETALVNRNDGKGRSAEEYTRLLAADAAGARRQDLLKMADHIRVKAIVWASSVTGSAV